MTFTVPDVINISTDHCVMPTCIFIYLRVDYHTVLSMQFVYDSIKGKVSCSRKQESLMGLKLTTDVQRCPVLTRAFNGA